VHLIPVTEEASSIFTWSLF